MWLSMSTLSETHCGHSDRLWVLQFVSTESSNNQSCIKYQYSSFCSCFCLLIFAGAPVRYPTAYRTLCNVYIPSMLAPKLPVKMTVRGYSPDRGQFSCEVILHLFALKLRHPDKVFLIRGNHECSAVR